MINMYKELCTGIFILLPQLILSSMTYIILDEFLKQSNYTFFFPSIDYPIVSIEDPFDKEDWEHFKHFSNLGICQVGLSFFLFGEFVSAVSSQNMLPQEDYEIEDSET